MSEQNFPPGWDEARVKRLIDHYENMDEDELLAEDEAAREAEGQTIMIIPTDLVPAVRELIARKPIARTVAWACYAMGQADCMLAVAEKSN